MERNQQPVIHITNKTKATHPQAIYNGEDFTIWQIEARKKLEELLGLPYEFCNDSLEIEYDIIHNTHKEIRFTFQSEKGYFVPCHLLIPIENEHPRPIVICLQGHSSGMHISLGKPKFKGDEEDIADGDRDFALGVLKKGFCALTIEQRGLGESGGNPLSGIPQCYNHTMANLLIGRTTIGERVWDVCRAIDVMEKYFSDIFDKNNIICLGNSAGGTTTFYTACLDKRIKTAIPSCCFASYDDSIAAMYHCSCNYIPNIRKFFDMGDLGGLIAPRTLLIVSGEKDTIFPIDSAKKSFETVKTLYDKAGGICRHIIGPDGHRFYYDLVWEMYDKTL